MESQTLVKAFDRLVLLETHLIVCQPPVSVLHLVLSIAEHRYRPLTIFPEILVCDFICMADQASAYRVSISKLYLNFGPDVY